jgi:hypothetical protein
MALGFGRVVAEIATEAAKETGSTGIATIVNSTSKGLTQCGYLTGNATMTAATVASTTKFFARGARVGVRVCANNGKLDWISGTNVASMAFSGASTGLRMSSILLQNGTISYATAGVAKACHVTAIGLSAFADGLEGGNETVSQRLYNLFLA